MDISTRADIAAEFRCEVEYTEKVQTSPHLDEAPADVSLDRRSGFDKDLPVRSLYQMEVSTRVRIANEFRRADENQTIPDQTPPHPGLAPGDVPLVRRSGTEENLPVLVSWVVWLEAEIQYKRHCYEEHIASKRPLEEWPTLAELATRAEKLELFRKHCAKLQAEITCFELDLKAYRKRIREEARRRRRRDRWFRAYAQVAVDLEEDTREKDVPITGDLRCLEHITIEECAARDEIECGICRFEYFGTTEEEYPVAVAKKEDQAAAKEGEAALAAAGEIIPNEKERSHEEESQVVVIKSCNHVFHRECVTYWLKEKNTCPMCRKVVEHTSRDPKTGNTTGTPAVAAV